MGKIKVGIVEDDAIIACGLVQALTTLGYDTTEVATTYSEALEMVDAERPDILLLDITLSGKKDGIDVAWQIREDYNLPFIFLTGNSDPATVERAKKLCPPAYLVKPFNKEELYTSIEICLHNFTTAQDSRKPDEGNYVISDSVFVKQGHMFQKVRIQDIVYLESDNVYIHVHTLKNKLLVRSTIQNYLDLLNSKRFFRVHRSFAINIDHVEAINADNIYVGSEKIPIGKAYREELLGQLRLG